MVRHPPLLLHGTKSLRSAWRVNPSDKDSAKQPHRPGSSDLPCSSVAAVPYGIPASGDSWLYALWTPDTSQQKNKAMAVDDTRLMATGDPYTFAAATPPLPPLLLLRRLVLLLLAYCCAGTPMTTMPLPQLDDNATAATCAAATTRTTLRTMATITATSVQTTTMTTARKKTINKTF